MDSRLKIVLIGSAAGLLAALLWAGFSYATGHELGWIAWGVGLIIGLGVRWADAEADGWWPGVIAAIIAIPSLLGGKYLAARFVVAREFASLSVPADIDPDIARMELANEVVAEYESQNRKLIWPEKNRMLTTATKGPQTPDEYPTDVWKETSNRWARLPTAEKDRRLTLARNNLTERLVRLRSQAIEQAFGNSFSPFDILWFILAIGTAFRVGSRLATSEE